MTISILAAILFPVFASAREKARQTSCASSEKQLGLAFLQYVQDYDECFPGGNNDPSTNAPTAPYANAPDAYSGSTWDSQIYPYVKSVGVYACPDDANPVAHDQISYQYNTNLGGFDTNEYTTGVWWPCIKLSQLNAPSLTIVLIENNEGDYYFDPSVAYPAYSAPWGPWNNYSYGAATSCDGNLGGVMDVYFPGQVARHTGGVNFLAADGHVKWLRPETVSPGRTYGAAGVVQSQTISFATSTDCMALYGGTCGDGQVTMTFSYY